MGRTPCCSKIGLNRGPWTPEEDDLLIKHIGVYGEGGWRTLPKKAGLLRCGKSCRLRWMNYLRPDVKRGQISPEEEDLILRLHRLLGNRWSLIAGRIPGRTDNEIKNYWNTHLSKKLISQGIDPRTHKPLSESEVAAVSDSPGNSSKSAQKTLQPQTSDYQHVDLPPQNLGPAIASDSQEAATEETAKPADNYDNEYLQNFQTQGHHASSPSPPKRPETSVIVRSPQLVSSVFNDFCAGEMNSNHDLSSCAKSTQMGPADMKSCHAFDDSFEFNSLDAHADSDKGLKQTRGSSSINNLAPVFSSPDHHTPGMSLGIVIEHDCHAPYLRTNSVTSNYYMAPSIIAGAGLHCTSFFGQSLDPATSDLSSPLISRGTGNPLPHNGTWEQSVTMQHAICSVNGVESIRMGELNSSVHGSTYSNVVHSAAQTPASVAGHEDCNSDIFSSFLDSFINEELLNENNDPVAPAYVSQIMQQSSESDTANFNYDSSSLMPSSLQYLPK